MQYLITFLEGLISFLSPCMLPLLPVYIFYFGGGDGKPACRETEQGKTGATRGRILVRALAFVLGFTVLFCLMGLFAGTLGTFLAKYQKWVNLAAGLLVILFGLSYLEVVRLPFFKSGAAAPVMKGAKGEGAAAGLSNLAAAGSAFLFGMVYAVSLTPCVGAFLGSALMLASAAGTALQGFLLLLVYSLGLGIPFLLSALLLEELKGAFQFVKKNYAIINRVCGAFLILVGAAMALGLFEKLMTIFG
ncbi:MAG: cytochrome c biogenesis protein CcdA [Clostridiales bacterium]|nr:cytochrome c biogenesis protein CcdA [Clostridiales bacterium]